jgi:hypothetical protein
MKLSRWFSGVCLSKRRNLSPKRRLERRWRPELECLEERTVPTIVFAPQFGTEATIFRAGPKLSSTPVYLILWGSYWNSAVGYSQVSTIISSVSAELSSPIFSGLTQYGSNGLSHYQAAWTDTALGDPSTVFFDSQLQSVVLNAINDPNSPIFPPGSGTTPLYVVVTPPGVAPLNLLQANGYHSDFAGATTQGTQNLAYAWLPYNGSLDALTTDLSREVADAITDPYPTSGVSVQSGATWNPSGTGDIGDFEATAYTYRVDGLLTQALWDVNANAFTVHDGTSQNFYLTPAWNNLDQFLGSSLSLKPDNQVNTVSIDETSAGGITVTMNNEVVTFNPGQITSVQVEPPAGSAQLQLSINDTNVPVTVVGSASDDTVEVGNGTDGVQGITAPIHVSSSQLVSLTINDASDTGGRTASISATSVSGLAPATISYDPPT